MYAESSGRDEELETSAGSEAALPDNSWAFGQLCSSDTANRGLGSPVPVLPLEPTVVEAILTV